jgi:DNA-binding transcriptional LysR family regulator
LNIDQADGKAQHSAQVDPLVRYMPTPRIALDQWRAFTAVVDQGGCAKAARALHKSQSTVSYAVQQVESLLGVEAFRIAGRKAELTPTGELLYRRARYLLDEAAGLEQRHSGCRRVGKRRCVSRSK